MLKKSRTPTGHLSAGLGSWPPGRHGLNTNLSIGGCRGRDGGNPPSLAELLEILSVPRATVNSVPDSVARDDALRIQ
jgi:hypothetical protein